MINSRIKSTTFARLNIKNKPKPLTLFSAASSGTLNKINRLYYCPFAKIDYDKIGYSFAESSN